MIEFVLRREEKNVKPRPQSDGILVPLRPGSNVELI